MNILKTSTKFVNRIYYNNNKNKTKHDNLWLRGSDLNYIPSGHYGRVNLSALTEIQKVENFSKHQLRNYTGCIMGGAIGDALGTPVEFLNLNQIKRIHGEQGVTDLHIADSGFVEISDDTQMTFFTADGLIKAIGKKFDNNKIPDMNIVHKSYLDWLETQTSDMPKSDKNKGWISKILGLYERRAPGDTCINSLKSGEIGTMEKPLNYSKGNGGIMRVAPVGLLYYKNPKMAFEVGARCAAITHGHPSGFLSAGAFASIVAYLVQGKSIEDAVDNSIKILDEYKNSDEVKENLILAKELAKSEISPEEAVKKIGGGWVGEEALGIAVYCALKSPDNFEKAVLMSVNHNGDSDSTGAITGNIMGLYLGEEAIPQSWKERVELRQELRQLSKDLYVAEFDLDSIKERYPYNCGRTPNWYQSFTTNNKPSHISHVQFSPEAELKMKKMTKEEEIKYKKYLLENKLYSICSD